MVSTARKIDARPIVGAVVVFLIIGLVIFGIYYFLIAKPAADTLSASKLTAMDQINSLVTIGTLHAISNASTYSAMVLNAGSSVEVESILVEVNAATQREQTRKELLDLIATAADGTCYSATSSSGKVEAPSLAELSETLTAEVNSKATKADLDAYRAEIDNKANLTWRDLLNSELDKLGDNVAMFKNSPVSGGYMTNSEARNYIAGLGWEIMRELKFERYGTVEVPALDTFQRTSTVIAGSTVNVYIYDRHWSYGEPVVQRKSSKRYLFTI